MRCRYDGDRGASFESQQLKLLVICTYLNAHETFWTSVELNHKLLAPYLVHYIIFSELWGIQSCFETRENTSHIVSQVPVLSFLNTTPIMPQLQDPTCEACIRAQFKELTYIISPWAFIHDKGQDSL